MSLVSVIIPVFNKKDYLNDCLESVHNQHYKDIEIILIDDGSSDGSSTIIKMWAEIDNRIRSYIQINKGVSFTRNRGLELSKGEFIFFLDADDSIEEDTINILVNEMHRTNADIILSNYFFHRNGFKEKNIDLKDYQLINDKNIDSLQIKADLFLTNGRPMSSVCNKLYRKKFIFDNSIKFKDGVFAEDRLFNLMCYVNNPVILTINKFTYHIKVNENSRSKEFSDTFFKQNISLFHIFYDYLLNKKVNLKYDTLLQLTLIYDIDKILHYYYKYSKGYKDIVSVIRLIKRDHIIIETIKRSNREKTLSLISGRKLYLKRIRLFNQLLVYLPNSLFAYVYITFKRFR